MIPDMIYPTCCDAECREPATVGPRCPAHAIARYRAQVVRRVQWAEECTAEGCVRLATYDDKCSRHRARGAT